MYPQYTQCCSPEAEEKPCQTVNDENVVAETSIKFNIGFICSGTV